MGRSGYVDDFDYDEHGTANLYRAAVERAIKGKRGQAFLREMLDALEAMPDKRLITDDLERDGEVCAIGSVGARRGIDMKALDPEDADAIATAFGIAPSLVCEIEYENDDDFSWSNKETPEQRYERVVKWIRQKLAPANGGH